MLNQLELEFAEMKYRWKIHSDLFDSEANVDLLNRCGGIVFGLLQRLLIYDILAALCRLCDPAQSNKHENNSIHNQFDKQKERLSESEIQEIDGLLVCLDTKMKNIKCHRNKSISHNDLKVAQNVITLPDIIYGEIDEAFDMIGEILNKIFCSAGNYDVVGAFVPGPAKLLKVLKAGEEKLNG